MKLIIGSLPGIQFLEDEVAANKGFLKNNYKQMKRVFIITVCFLAIFAKNGISSNIQISNINQYNVDESNQRISFDLEWDDSWRMDSQEPFNYDGVWIFVKYRNCLEKDEGTPGNYNHCWLSTNSSDHTIFASTVDGSSVDMEVEVGLTNIDGTDQGMGIFIYQPAGDRVGSVVIDSLSLLWVSGEQDENTATNSYDIQVVGIEMVNIPTGSYYLGDGTSGNTFRDVTNTTSTNMPVHVTSDAMDFMAASGNGYGNLSPDYGASANVSNDFPNGYNSFWAMKYEISQEQYMQFLNTLSRTCQNYRVATSISTSSSTVTNIYVMSNSTTLQYRNAIVCESSINVGGEPVEFHMDYDGDVTYDEDEDGANIACNYLSNHDVLAYLDWAALRPLTEFEYEKMARGPFQGSFGFTQQKAWGTATVTEVTGIENEGTGTESSSNSGDGICVYNNNTSVNGPLRCGFASDENTEDRYSCGASYYGLFELSGNVYEGYMSILRGTTYADDFGGESGDGLLNDDANSNQETWPLGEDGSGSSNYYLYYRGGYWSVTNSANLAISYRANSTNSTTRYNYTGGRGGRFVSK